MSTPGSTDTKTSANKTSQSQTRRTNPVDKRSPVTETPGPADNLVDQVREALTDLPDDKNERRTKVFETLDELVLVDTPPVVCRQIAQLIHEETDISVHAVEQHLRDRRTLRKLAQREKETDRAKAAKANQKAHRKEIHARGGLDLWDNSTPQIHWWVVPDPEDIRLAWLYSLDLTDPDATPRKVRNLPAPQGQILYGGERRPLVYTLDNSPVVVTPEELLREIWIMRCGGRPGGSKKMQDILREAFLLHAEQQPVIKPAAEVKDGKIQLPPRGVTPPGWQELPEHASSVEMRTAWKQWAVLAARQPGGLLAHLAGAAIDALYIGAGRRQSHAIDLVGRDVHIGKSSAGFCLAAMIGDPDQALIPFDVASPISVTTLLGQVNTGPLVMDESQLFKATPEERALTIFRAAQGGQRTRSKSDGSGVNRGLPYSGILFVTGNLRFVSDETIDAVFVGLSRRYLVFNTDRDHPVTESDAAATQLKVLALAGHGYLASAILDHVPLAEHEARIEKHWTRLKEGYRDRSAEVLRLLAGHLAGADAIDHLLGTHLSQAVAEHVVHWLTDSAHVPRPIHELWLDKIRGHIAENIERWPYPIQYAAHRHPDWADQDDNFEQVGAPIRKPLGVRDPDGQWFAIFSKASFTDLCHEFEIADPDAVLRGLDEARSLKVPQSARTQGTLQNSVPLGSFSGKQAKIRAYDIRAPWLTETDCEEDDPEDSSGPSDNDPTDPTPPTSPTVDPFATTPPATSEDAARPGTAEPAEPAKVGRAWLPNPIRRNKAGDFTGTITAVNMLLELQARKGRAQVHNHPYPTDDDIPEPLRLLARGQGTGVHDGFHRYVKNGLPAGTRITRLDRNAAYLPAIGSAKLPLDGLRSYEGRGPAKQVGIYHIGAWPELTSQACDQGIPHPWGVLAPVRRDLPLWVPQALLDLGDRAVSDGIFRPFAVAEALTGPAPRAGRAAYTRWSVLYRHARNARAEAIEVGDKDTEDFLKSVYSKLVSTAGESGSNTRIWRPEIPPMIRACAFANVWRQAMKFRAAGIEIASIVGNDEIHIIGDAHTLFETTIDGEPLVIEGRGLDQIKVKGGYVLDGNGDRAAEWDA